MTAFAALTLQNNAAANVTFGTAGISGDGIARWMTNDSVYDAKSVVTMQVNLPKAGGTAIRVKQRVVVPLMDTVDTSKKVDEAYVNIDIKLPKNASETMRLDIRKYAEKLIANAVTTDAVQKFESIF